MMVTKYDYRSCQSLFGYAAEVHRRSGGVCQLCGCGAGQPLDFDLWRQMTVEHLLGRSQGGYPDQIRAAVAERFPELSEHDREAILRRIDEANTVTACSFCNSATSRNRHTRDMRQMLNAAQGVPEQVVEAVITELGQILHSKQHHTRWKLESVREAFEAQIKPTMARR